MSKRGHNEGGIDWRPESRLWRLRWRAGDKRYSKNFRGTKTAARAELGRLLESVRQGTDVAPKRTTVADYLRGWLDADSNLSPKTAERYRELVERQIVPHLGGVVLQNLRPAQISEWYAKLLKAGGAAGGPLSARTVGHAHRVLHRGLERAFSLELVARNVTHAIRPPRIADKEVVSLGADQITDMLRKLDGHALHPIAVLALGTGMRRAEICALAWGAVDLDAGVVRVERSLEETKAGLRFKSPKTRSGRRAVSLPASVVDVLRRHRQRQLEHRVMLGLGRIGDDDLVFGRLDGSPYPPDTLSRDWWRATIALGLPRIAFHGLRHSSASALIAAGLDVGSVSRRLGHSNPSTTLRVYTHAFSRSDEAAAEAMDRAIKGSG